MDERLLGTWQSDRRKTFLHYKPSPKSTPQQLRNLKALFGKLVVRWERQKYHTELDGYFSSEPYIVLASDVDSVVIRHRDKVTRAERLQQIHFEEDWYWTATWGLIEWFRRVA